MSDLGLSTIAQLLFRNEKSFDFTRLVIELENVLGRFQAEAARLAWDCDDLVCFDIPGTRIQLAWSAIKRRGYGACLTIAVGPGEPASPRFHEDMCSRLVDRIQTRFDPVAVMWCQVEGDVGFEVIDDLTEALPHLGTPLPEVDSLVETLTEQEARLNTRAKPAERPGPATHSAQPRSPIFTANDGPDLPRPRERELARVRQALYPRRGSQPPCSTQMRLAVHCMNATLILVWAPMGVAVMAHTMLRGEDIRLSSRVMAVTGTFLALAQSPLGMTMAAMAQSIS